jgi:hypothetical protein
MFVPQEPVLANHRYLSTGNRETKRETNLPVLQTGRRIRDQQVEKRAF